LRNEEINHDVMMLQIYIMREAADPAVSTRDRSPALQAAQNNLWAHHLGLEYLSDLLEEAKSEIASDGYMSEEIRDTIYFAFCSWNSSFALACSNARPPELEMEDRPSEKMLDKQIDEERCQIVALIDQQLEKISKFKDSALEREELSLDAQSRSFSLPPLDATDKLFRYETLIVEE